MPAPQHELKYVFSAGRVFHVRQWLGACCRPDPKFSAGKVCSIYYDTRDWRFLGEKIDSDYLKTKIRVRWYADIRTGEPYPDTFLEAKYKIGGTREKIRVKTGKHGEWFSRVTLDNPGLQDFPRLLWKEGVMPHGPLFPAFRIDYKRLRFIEPVTGARLSLDYDICSPAVNCHMLPGVDTFRLPEAVFELKGPLSQLPGSLHPLINLGCRKESFSKYGRCYEKIMKVTF